MRCYPRIQRLGPHEGGTPNPAHRPALRGFGIPPSGGLFRAVCALAAALCTEAHVLAADAPADDEVILSPFEVSAERDSGYVATNTLAGSRLNTSLRETPAAISVLTKEFLTDIGALNVSDALEYALSAGNDIGGGSANVGATTGNDLIANDYSFQIRGFRRATQTRDYFDTILDGDTFNLERIDVARGPNSILFGIGGPGGIVNVTPKRAALDRAHTELSFRAGSWSFQRAALDLNQPIVDDKVAVRINLLAQDADGYRDFESDEQERAALALTWRPMARTQLRLSGEAGQLRQNKVRPWLPFEYISQWDFWGRRLVPFGTPESPWTLGDTNYSQQQRSNGSGAPANNLPLITDPVWGDELLTAGNRVSGNGRVALMDGPLAGRVLYVGTRAEGARYYRTSGARNISNYNSPANIEDESIFPRRGNITGPGQRVDTEYSTAGVTLEQRVGRSLFFEAAANHARVERRNQEVAGFANIAIQYDVTSTLPTFNADGTYDAAPGGPTTTGQGVGALNLRNPIPNPHLGKLLVVSLPRYSDTTTTRDDVRLSATQALDLSSAGVHTLLAFASRAKTTREEQGFVEANVHPQRAASNHFTNVPPRVYHVDPFSRVLAERGMPDPFKQPIPATALSGRPTEFFESGFVRNNWSRSKTQIDSGAIAAHSRWFGEQFVTTLGARRDRIRIWNHALVRNAQTQEVTGLTAPSASALDQSGTTYTAGAVWHLTSLAGPSLAKAAGSDSTSAVAASGDPTFQKALAPRLSLFANRSTNFKDQGGQQYFEDAALRPQLEIGPLKGRGLDYGVKADWLDGRVNATLTRFEVDLEKQASGHQSNVFNYINAIWTTLLNDGPNTVEPDATHPLGHRVGGTDTRSQRSRGWELELTANPTRNWRLSFNASKSTNAIAQLGGALASYMEKHRAEWQAHAALQYDTNRSPGFLNNAGGQNTVGALIFALDEWLAFVRANEGQIETNIRPWNANAFTAYRFNSARLRGLTIGGGLNYRGDQILGVRPPTLADPTKQSFKGGACVLAHAMVAYEFNLRERTTVKLQLNVDNLFDHTDRQVLASNWNPTTQSLETFHYFFEPRTWSVSTTVGF